MLTPQVTGSGKTLAFAIPVVEILLKRTSYWSKMEVRWSGRVFWSTTVLIDLSLIVY